MRILFVNEKAGYFGGVEQNVADAAAALGARGCSCVLAYGTLTERDPDGYRSLFREAIPCRDLIDPPGEGGETFQSVVERVSPDVVYLHKLPRISPVSPLFGRVRTVRMVHDHDLCCPRRHKYYLLNNRVCRHPAGWRCYLDGAFLERSRSSRVPFHYVPISPKIREMRRNLPLDAVIVGSRFMREELIQNGFPAGRIHVLPPVVPGASGEPKPVPEDPVILYVGQLIRGKGVDLLLRALKRLTGRFRAVIAGAGNAETRLQGLAGKLGISDRVRFLGWVDHGRLETLYDEAKIVAVPSRWPEPFGMIGLEAMRRGRPVVAFDVGGISDWLEHGVTGYLVGQQDVCGFAKALQELLDDTARASDFGMAAWEKAQRDFSFDQYMDRLTALLRGAATLPKP